MTILGEFDTEAEAREFVAKLDQPFARAVAPRGKGGKWKVLGETAPVIWKRSADERPIPAGEFSVEPLRADLMAHTFAPLRYSFAPYFPLRGTASLNAEGGVGKSYFMLGQQLHGAAGKPYLGVPTREGVYVYLSCEDDTEIVERRAQKILATFSEAERAKVHQNFRIIDGVGKGLQFVMCSDGMAGIAPTVDKVIAAVKVAAAGRPVVQVVGDTVARLNGGDEIAAEVMSAVEQAGARCAQALDCAWVWLAHVSKEVARSSMSDVHVSRGSSAFGDNCRSVVRLMPLTWKMVTALKLDGLDRAAVDRGDVLLLVHAKLNQDRKADPVYLSRGADGVLKRIEIKVRTDAQSIDAEMQSLVKWFNGARKSEPFTISAASRTARLEWTRLSKHHATAFLEEAARDGRLVQAGVSKGAPVYAPSADALTQQVHADPDGWL